MHIVTRAIGALVTVAAVTATSLPAHAVEDRVTVDDRLEQIALVDDAVPVGQSPLDRVGSDGRVTLETASSPITLDLPVASGSTVSKVDGRYLLPAAVGASVAVAPTSTGTQILVGIESAEAPTSYDFGLDAPEGFSPELRSDGVVDIVSEAGEIAAQVEAPWAIDAGGRRVPTRFELRGGTLRQIVDHRAGGFAYPIVADPKVKFCDVYTAVCVKFTKAETTKASDAFFVSVGAAVGRVCGIIPAKNPAGLAVAAVCAGAVAGYFYYLRGKFSSAKKQKKCVEVKFRVIGPAVVTAKVVKC